MAENIFLIGFMGAGKSTAARMLKDRCKMQLLEMDEEIEAREKMKISEIFKKEWLYRLCGTILWLQH